MLLAPSSVVSGFDPEVFKSSVSDVPTVLTGASAFDGPAEVGAALLPSQSRASRIGQIAIWTFAGSFEHAKWIACDGAMGAVRLAARVDDRAHLCRATFQRAGPGKRPSVDIACE